ncbi:hypothetical protein B0O99DRAFT_664513 [Bisporella sp. PMI_857]|nr:hypothetical protein B0O99DRAFT_664513 [Bisporella sp. PMI_857]
MADPLSITASAVGIIVPALHGTRLPLEDLFCFLAGSKEPFSVTAPDTTRRTRPSENGKLALQDRANVEFFNQGQIKAMSEQLSNCELTINSVIKKTISTKQIEVKVLENKLEALNLSSDDDEDAGSKECKTEALRQLEEQFKRAGSTTVTFGAQNSGFQAVNISGE